MGRLSSTIAVLMLSLAPGLAAAAPVSSFSVAASAQMTLAGATFADGGDALGSLLITYGLDQLDDFPQQSGNASVVTAFNYTEATGLVSASGSGGASLPFGSAIADVQGRLTQTITNTSASTIELAFSYALLFDGLASGPDAEVFGSAFVELQDFFGQVFFEEIPFFLSPPQSRSGATTLMVGAGETVYAAAYSEVFGSAFAFVPLPASLPLMLGGLAGLAAWRWRRAV